MTQNMLRKQLKTFSRQRNEIFFNCQVSQLISTQLSCFSLTLNKTKDTKTHKQAATKGGCSKGLAKHFKGGNLMLVKSMGPRLQLIAGFKSFFSPWAPKTIFICKIIVVCPIIFEPLKMGGLCLILSVIPEQLMQYFGEKAAHLSWKSALQTHLDCFILNPLARCIGTKLWKIV